MTRIDGVPDSVDPVAVRALLAALPERSEGLSRLTTIPGMVPGLYDRPTGCLFAPRCSHASAPCRAARPALRELSGGAIRCHTPLGALAPVAGELA
mgnify:CR=1 FL=1